MKFNWMTLVGLVCCNIVILLLLRLMNADLGMGSFILIGLLVGIFYPYPLFEPLDGEEK